ncbi:TRPM8 channel-associated factor homolog isoform X2 [Kryptolebias marmoratus]|uniref:TRPM8 channel-associated factor homolog isoform X2 n=1 Tax=Kryptolebias marmoratus TaxID=37003 RepID=UPI0018ACDB5D|nr:TRPM8 channel-associated factor homolog isoform X2 [Kryptolebias marmoratus]
MFPTHSLTPPSAVHLLRGLGNKKKVKKGDSDTTASMVFYLLCSLFTLPLLIISDQPTQSYHEDAYKSLVKGLKELDLRSSSVPCNLVLSGENAFPVVMNSDGHVLMAASRYGRGRVVVLSHERYLTLSPALVENAVIWLGGGESENLSLGVHQNLKAVADNLSKSNFQVSLVEGFSGSLGVSVYVSDAYQVGASAGDLVAFIKAGGGVLIGGQAWNWAAQNPNENLILQFSGNKVSGVAGIYFSDQYAKGENLPISPEIPTSWKSLNNEMNITKDLEFLLKGISEFDIRGSAAPSEALIHGALAFPIGTTNDGHAFLAGSYYGRGRVILATHETFLGEEKLASFWNNAFHWLDQGRNGVIGFGQWANILPNLEFTSEKTTFRQDLSVYVCTVWSEEDPEKIQNFVAEGGGLVVVGQAWSWASRNPALNPLQDFSGNKILNKMGLSVMKKTVSKDIFKTPEPSKANYLHFRHLLHRLASHAIDGTELTKQDEEHFEQLRLKFSYFLSIKAYDSSVYTQTLSKVTDIVRICKPTVSKENPLKSPKDHTLLNLAIDLYDYSLNKDAFLTYLMKNISKLPEVNNQTVQIIAQTEDEEWISTGLYLSPGMKTWITVPPNLVKDQWKIQIGCQSDRLYDREEYYRPPVVIKTFPVTSERMQVWNVWGGLIYLVAPPNVTANEEVVVEVAVSAPYYKSGVTKAEDWSSIREAPAPWAEFEFENIILTAPSHFIRNLEFPLELEKMWNDIMRGIADLSVIPHKFIRKERIVADVQIAAGWMHAGYPVMIHFSTASRLFSLEYIKTTGLWGELHELGHNQQKSYMEFRLYTKEATCNLWALYVNEEVIGVNRVKANGVTPEFRKGVVEKYINGGRNLSDWYTWTAFETYMQLQERFGWDAFKKVFAAYQKMSNFPSDNEGKMNLYAETFSQTVNMNLTGFLKAWGWPIETATEEKLSSLPPWSDHLMAQYS